MRFDAPEKVFQPLSLGEGPALFLDRVFQSTVRRVNAQPRQVIRDSPHAMVDGHLVVVQDDDEPRPGFSSVV